MADPFPSGPRLLAGVGAAAAGLYFCAAQPAFLLAKGYPLTAGVMAVTALPLVAFFAMMAFFPAALQRVLGRFTRADLRDGGHVAALVVMAGTLFLVLGYGSLVNGAFAYESEVVKGEGPAPIDANTLFVGLIFNVIVLVLPPLFYVAFVREGGPTRAIAALGLRSEGAGRAILLGVAATFGILIMLALLSLVFEGLNVQVPDNARALEIARSVTVLGALGIAIGSSLSEEIFFRGFLQPRIGLFGQAVFFALAHLSYVNVLEVVVTFALALVFGLIYRATGNLWAPIAGHFTFNLVMLVAGIYAPLE